MRPPRELRRPGLVGLVGLVVVGLLAGCAGMPESGPVVESDRAATVDSQRASDHVPEPPGVGDSRLDVARGFLDAMTASPIRVDVARQFLTESAAAEWNPRAATITYADSLPARDDGSRVTVRLLDAERLDSTGAWQGELPPAQERLNLTMTVEDGEQRITDPPDALVVPAGWFAQRFTQASRYFFDRTGRILVPEPVFVPRGDQLASSLISGLLAGPGPDLRRVARSFLPSGLRIGLSVPVSSDGVADIELTGDSGALTPDASSRLLAQLAWTLRQVPGIDSMRVTIGGAPVRGADTETTYPVETRTPYDPTGANASTALFALQNGRLRRADGPEFETVEGPFADPEFDLRSVAVDLPADRAVAITSDGTRAVRGPLSAKAGDGGRQPALSTVVRGGTDLLRPAWDFAGRAWFVDRQADGAVVSYVDPDGARHLVQVPGVTGRRVRSFIISRDGTRFVAAVRGAETDQVLLSRIEVDGSGRISGATAGVPLGATQGEQSRVVDLTWTSPTTVALLSPVSPAELFEVRTLTVDGSPTNSENLSTTLRGRVVALAGTPVPDLTDYAVSSDGLIDLSTGGSLIFSGDEPPRSAGYVG